MLIPKRKKIELIRNEYNYYYLLVSILQQLKFFNTEKFKTLFKRFAFFCCCCLFPLNIYNRFKNKEIIIIH